MRAQQQQPGYPGVGGVQHHLLVTPADGAFAVRGQPDHYSTGCQRAGGRRACVPLPQTAWGGGSVTARRRRPCSGPVAAAAATANQVALPISCTAAVGGACGGGSDGGSGGHRRPFSPTLLLLVGVAGRVPPSIGGVASRSSAATASGGGCGVGAGAPWYSDFNRLTMPRPTRMYMMLPATVGANISTDTHHLTFFTGDGCALRGGGGERGRQHRHGPTGGLLHPLCIGGRDFCGRQGGPPDAHGMD